jgi:hypothetical protein
MSKWTPEIVAYICREYLDERKSAGEIAKALNYAFSRNAVTGKLLRVGALGQRKGVDLGKNHGLPKKPPERKARSEKRQPKRKAAPHKIEAAPPPPVETGPEAEPADLKLVARAESLFEGPGIPLLEASSRHCRWPAKSENGAPHVCGLAKARGAYCAFHAGIAYGPLRRRRLDS